MPIDDSIAGTYDRGNRHRRRLPDSANRVLRILVPQDRDKPCHGCERRRHGQVNGTGERHHPLDAVRAALGGFPRQRAAEADADEGHFVCVALRALPHPAFEPFEDVIRRTQVEAAVPRSHREALPREKPAQMRRRNIGRAKSGHDDDRFVVTTRSVLRKLQRRSARPYETSDFAQPRAHRNGRTALRPGDKSIGWKNGHGPRQPWKEAIGKCHDLSANGIALRIYGKRFSPNVGEEERVWQMPRFSQFERISPGMSCHPNMSGTRSG